MGLLPWLLVAGFLALIWVLFGEKLLPAREVRLETVVTLRPGETSGDPASPPAETAAAADPWEAPMQFQASGWIEPDPLPIMVTSLVDGVVETVAVLDGETVSKGQVLVTLIRDDFEFDLATAESALAARMAEKSVQAADIRVLEAKRETLRKKVFAGEQRCRELEDRRDRLERAGSTAVAEGEVEQARLMLATHTSEVAALEATEMELQAELIRLEAEQGEIDSRIREAETEVARKRLALERTEIRAPVDGVIQHLDVVPGLKRMLGMDSPKSSTIAEIFQPDSLQARIDVPLEEAAQLGVGQHVRLRSGFLPGEVIRGVVTRIVGQADLQRNTLQAKVRIIEPDRRLRPEMLCRAEFLEPVGEGGAEPGPGSDSSGGRVALFVPASAVVDRDGDSALVWTPDRGGERIESRRIEIGDSTEDGFHPVRSGLRPGDRVVVDPPADLEEGERIRPLPARSGSTQTAIDN